MSEAQIKNNKIFWIDVDTIFPNPYQPRHEFDEDALRDLSDSIRQYGVMQPITVTEAGKSPDGRNKYELIAGERRLRASKMADLKQIPAVVRIGDDDKARFELAIIENLQREDLNPIERARAFQRLIDEFALTHAHIGKKMGKSREYVSNTLRLLSLPLEIMEGLAKRKISEGHTRPLMMLADRPDEQLTLFKEIVYKKMSVRESERIARKIAQDRVRKDKHRQDPQLASIEQEFSETLGTRVSIEKGERGGKIVIDYFSPEDLEEILNVIRSGESAGDAHALLARFDTQHKDQEQKQEDTVVIQPQQLAQPIAQPLQRPQSIPEKQTPAPVFRTTVVQPLEITAGHTHTDVPVRTTFESTIPTQETPKPKPKPYTPYTPYIPPVKTPTPVSVATAVVQPLELEPPDQQQIQIQPQPPVQVQTPDYSKYAVPLVQKAKPVMRFDSGDDEKPDFPNPAAPISFSI